MEYFLSLSNTRTYKSMQYNIAGYLLFAFITAITPGPNNLLLFSMGKAYGLKSSVNAMAGIFLGFFTLLYLSGYGIGWLITSNPHLAIVLKIAASAWFVYLAFLIKNLNSNDSNTTVGVVGFKQAYAMQFLNPKAWIMAINGATVFMPNFSNTHLNVFVFACIFNIVGIPCMLFWVLMGDSVSRLLKSQRANQIISYTIVVLMLLCIVTVWL